MQYCNKSLIKNNNEILQYFNKNNDIALVMHQRALLDMSGLNLSIINYLYHSIDVHTFNNNNNNNQKVFIRLCLSV